MFVNIATNLITLARNTNYRSNWINDSRLLKDAAEGSPADPLPNNAASSRTGNGHYDKGPVFRVLVSLCTLTGCFVRVWLWDTTEDGYTDIPVEAFAAGRQFDMYFKKYTLMNAAGSGGVEITDKDDKFVLIGFKTNVMPLGIG